MFHATHIPLKCCTCLSECRVRSKVNEQVIFYLPVLTEVRTLHLSVIKRYIYLIYYPGLTQVQKIKNTLWIHRERISYKSTLLEARIKQLMILILGTKF